MSSLSVLLLRLARPRLALFALAAPALLLAAPAASAQFLYGLALNGRTTINNTLLDKLPSNFDPETGFFLQQRWWDVDAEGADRYALRLDGRVFRNGKLHLTLPFSSLDTLPFWVSLDVTAAGVHVLQQSGVRTLDGVAVIVHPPGNFHFNRILAVPQTDPLPDLTTALRADGSVFLNLGTTSSFKFTGGAGPGGAGDGQHPEGFTDWVDLALEPVTGDLFALRADGWIWRAELPDGDDEGVQVAKLPAPVEFVHADRYVDIEFDGEGNWEVLRRDGAVFGAGSVITPIITYAGNGSSEDEIFVGLAFDGTTRFALRSDGRLYSGDTANQQLFKLPGGGYRSLAAGTEAPDLTNFKNPRPGGSPYISRFVEGENVSIPVLAWDLEKLPEDLLVTVDGELPEGWTFLEEFDKKTGAVTRRLEGGPVGPVGKIKPPMRLLIDDEVTKPRKLAWPVRVFPADLDPEKNRPPLPNKIRPVRLLVGFETVFPLHASDPDGDELAWSVNPEKGPVSLGAEFDEETAVFRWTPTFDDLGKHVLVAKVTDGTVTRTLKVVLRVLNPLVFEELEPDED